MERDIAIERRYELAACVSRGAFGEVLRATDKKTGQTVAIKRLHEHLVCSENTTRIMREAERIGEIDSPFVVKCFGWGRDNSGRACLVLEWLDGEDLAKRRAAQSVTEGIEIARQAAAGLAAIHQAGYVHGDIKPSNVVVSNVDGRVHVTLIDLGVARKVGVIDPATRGLIIGTPSYMSPEQARGEDVILPASDLFSLGIVLYELLAGRRPFTGSDPFVVLAKILLEDPPLLGAIAPHVPPALDALVMRALAKQPEQRFRSASDLMDALGRVPVMHAPMVALVDETPTVQLTPEALRPSAPPPAGMSTMAEQRVVTALFARFAHERVHTVVQRSDARSPRRKKGEPIEAVPDAHDPASAIEKAMAALESIVTEHRGVAHRTIGGRMIAVFGAVRSTGDEAERAAHAALAALSRVPGAQVAITTGRAVASLAGLSGAAIERGAAEVERAPRGSARIDEATARLIEAHFVVGGDEHERVLLGERPTHAPAPLLVGHETQMVGRDREILHLLALYKETVLESSSRSVQVIGAAGSGKSRLRFELLRRLGEPAPVLLFGRAESLSAGSPFGLLRGALRRAAEISSADTLATQQKKLRALFSRHLSGKALTRAALFLGELANVPFADDASEELRSARNDPMLMGDRMRAAWEEWLAAVSDESPLVIVLEDLHWGDLPSAKFVEAALRWLRDRALFVVAFARPEIQEEFEGTWVHRPTEKMVLGPLAMGARKELVHSVLPANTPEETVQFLCEKSEGNPFYLEELVRAVSGSLARRAAEEQTANSISNLDLRSAQLPETVLGMVQARLDALGGEAKAVLRAASILGNAFRPEGVAALLGNVPVMRLARVLTDLCTDEVITQRASRDRSGVEYVFRNATIRDAAYSMLTEDDRAAGHRLAAEFLERSGGADASTLAGHYARAREAEKAAQFYLRAAEEALEGNDFAAAIGHCERASQLSTNREVSAELRLLQAEAHRWRGELSQSEQCARDAARLSEEGSTTWFRAVAEVIAGAGRQGRYDDVALWTERAISAEPKATDTDAISAKVLFLSRAAVHLGYTHHEALARRLRADVDALTSGARSDPRTRARVHQIRALFGLRAGDAALYVREHLQALTAFEEAGDHRSACLERVSLGSGYADLGAYTEAEAALEQALAGAEKMGLLHIAPWAHQNLGHVRARLGRKAEARASLDRAREAGVLSKDARLAGGTLIYLSRLSTEEGDYAAAEVYARDAENTLGGVPAMLAGALAARARASIGAGNASEGLQCAQEAMGVLDKLGPGKMGEVEGSVRLALIEALLANGELRSAREAAALASERLASRASLLGDPSLRASFLSNVPEHAQTLALAKKLAGSEQGG
ncbi:MAG: protein kinase [Polyangiaceae bacterium]|nr:protein kinase [Polyangiaceae bacterium]